MAILAYFLNLAACIFAAFAGDDSIIKGLPNDDIDTERFSRLFNLEAKFFSFDNMYFCSKFLLPLNSYKWVFLPDPIKLMVKLGRSDLVNETHREYYRVSYCDTVKCYDDPIAIKKLSDAVTERYGAYFSTVEAIRQLRLAAYKNNFDSLFYSLPSDNIDKNRYNFHKLD